MNEYQMVVPSKKYQMVGGVYPIYGQTRMRRPEPVVLLSSAILGQGYCAPFGRSIHHISVVCNKIGRSRCVLLPLVLNLSLSMFVILILASQPSALLWPFLVA